MLLALYGSLSLLVGFILGTQGARSTLARFKSARVRSARHMRKLKTETDRLRREVWEAEVEIEERGGAIVELLAERQQYVSERREVERMVWN